MMPKCVVGAAIALLMLVTSGCASKPAYETKMRDLNTQAEKVQNDAEAKIKALEREIAEAKEAAQKERRAVADKIEGLERKLAAAKEATEKAIKEATDKIKALEGEVTAAKEAAAKAQRAWMEAEAKRKALEEKPAPKKPDADPFG